MEVGRGSFAAGEGNNSSPEKRNERRKIFGGKEEGEILTSPISFLPLPWKKKKSGVPEKPFLET